jgi:hypothetical protein
MLTLASVVAMVLLLSLPAAAFAGPVDFGPAARTGPEAVAGIDSRAALLRRTMACENELKFVGEIRKTFDSGRRDDNPDTKTVDESTSWRVPDLMAKAGFIAIPEPRMSGRLGDASGAPGSAIPELQHNCHAVLGLEKDVGDAWKPLLRSTLSDAATASDIVNQVYREVFGEVRLSRLTPAGPCDSPAHGLVDGAVVIDLSVECLARQIRAVISNPDHGPWVKDGKTGERIPQFPGTSAGKLPCLSKWEGKLEGVAGDWDMAVLEYTRLAYLLYRASAVQPSIAPDAKVALAYINRNLLTIRSGPDVGATAAESYNLVTGCGNFVNQSGDAVDTMNGDAADPNYDSYSEAARDELGKNDSFWDDLWNFLKSVLLVLAVAAAAALLAMAAAAAAAASLSSAAARAGEAMVAALGATIFIVAASASIQETENHLLMQNSDRYLKNKLMMAELSRQGNREAFDELVELNEELRVWILERLSRIAEEDFIEYNANPYNRLSHVAILNLLDYACGIDWSYDTAGLAVGEDRACDPRDAAVVTAAASVFDLSAAKLAVGSLQGRRLIPYRRLAEQNYLDAKGRSLLEQVAGADNLLGALQVWTGEMRHAPDQRAAEPTFSGLIWYATSRYKPNQVILGIAVDKSLRFDQQYDHWTQERYASGPGWLITAGGTDERPANGLSTIVGTFYPQINMDVANDRGVGVPTTLMTLAPNRSRLPDFLRFEGRLVDFGLLDEKDNGPGQLKTGKPLWSFSDNHCVSGPFACGIGLRYPSGFTNDARCRTRQIGLYFFVADSTTCPPFSDGDAEAGNDFFVAIFDSRQGWGFFEVAQQRDFGYNIDTYVADLKARNRDRIAKWPSRHSDDEISFSSPVQKKVLKFTPEDEDFDAGERACGVVNHESGSRFTISRAPAGSNCLSRGGRIFIDLNDPENPIRRGEGLTLDALL